jgi:hypothetical protein
VALKGFGRAELVFDFKFFEHFFDIPIRVDLALRMSVETGEEFPDC